VVNPGSPVRASTAEPVETLSVDGTASWRRRSGSTAVYREVPRCRNNYVEIRPIELSSALVNHMPVSEPTVMPTGSLIPVPV
jgi:hypothetical protein